MALIFCRKVNGLIFFYEFILVENHVKEKKAQFQTYQPKKLNSTQIFNKKNMNLSWVQTTLGSLFMAKVGESHLKSPKVVDLSRLDS